MLYPIPLLYNFECYIINVYYFIVLCVLCTKYFFNSKKINCNLDTEWFWNMLTKAQGNSSKFILFKNRMEHPRA